MSNDFVLLSQDQVDLLSKKTNRVRRHRFPDLVSAKKWIVSVGGKPLEAKDFRFEAEALVFTAGAVKTGDAIKVEAKD